MPLWTANGLDSRRPWLHKLETWVQSFGLTWLQIRIWDFQWFSLKSFAVDSDSSQNYGKSSGVTHSATECNLEFRMSGMLLEKPTLRKNRAGC